jgi:hypothetical protein
MKQVFKKFLWLFMAGGLFLISLNYALNGTLAVMSDQVASGISEFIAGTWDDLNCTHSIGYWKQHPETWPVDGLIFGKVAYTKEEALLIFDAHHRGDATYILAYQLIAARLNILNGADPSFLEKTLVDADAWLVANPLGSKPKNPGRKEGIALAEVLEMYNNGEIGPGMCLEDGRRNISSLASLESIFGLSPAESDPGDLGFSETPVGLLPELPGTPIIIQTPEQPETTPPLPRSEPPSTPEPTQTADPTQITLFTPTFAPTQDPYDVLTITPAEGVFSTPTVAPTADQSPTPTGIPNEPPQPTPTPAPTAYAGPPGCTQPLEYWTMDLEIWPLDEFYFAAEVYDQEGALGILLINPAGDATYILARQYITALLNIASPADPTAVIEVLDSVKAWFFNHPLGSEPKNPDRKGGLEYAAVLEDYNLGLQGPGRCEVPTPTPTPTSTSTPENLSTPTLAPTMAPTFMPTPTYTPTPELPTEPAP